MAVKLKDYVDDDLIATTLLMSGMSSDDLQKALQRTNGNIRAVLDNMSASNDSGTLKRFGLVKGYLDNLGTDHLEKLLSEGAGLDKNDVQTAVYWAQEEAGGKATPTLDRVLFHMGGATGRTQTQGAIDFAAKIRPGLQALGRGDSGLMTTRTQYRTGTKPPGPAPAPGGPPPAAPAPGGQGTPAAGSFGQPGFPGVSPYIYRSDIKPAPGTTKAPATGTSKATQGGGPGGGGPGAPVKGLPANATDDQVRKYFQENYGAEGWMLQVPDMLDIMKQVAHNPSGWSDSAIVSAVQKTGWWQQNGQNVADYLTQKDRDPVGFKEAQKHYATQIQNKTYQYGLGLSDQRIQEIADQAHKWGWKDEDINEALSHEFHFQNSQASVLGDKLKTDAKSYMADVDPATIERWGQQIIANPNAQNSWLEFLKEQAKSKFPSFATRLDAGETMKAIADPYAKIAGKYLEMDPEQVDFGDPKWMSALDQVDDKGNHTNMSYADWTRKIKTDAQYRYDFTDNAKQAATAFSTDILKRFGKIA